MKGRLKGRIAGALVGGLALLQMMAVVGDVSAVEAYYDEIPKISGEESRTVSYIYDGVTRTDFVLSSSSKYKKQAFTLIEFDPSQDDLYFEVRGGDPTYLTTKNRTSDTLARFNAEGEGKVGLVATNGGLWMSNRYNVRVLGDEANYAEGYENYPANVTKSYNIPWGFSMYGGEIVCSNSIEQETPSSTFRSFGIGSDGEALMGEIVMDIDVYNRTKGVTVDADGLNRLPADDALVMYTDRGVASNYCLSDAYEVVIDCDYDYTVTAGCRITGTVTAVSKPGEGRCGMQPNRIILTARGDRVDRISSFSIGDEISFTVNLEDVLDGKTKEWYTVTNCVGGHMPVIWDGESTGIESGNYYPVTILGIKENGNAVMLTSYGRQSSTGYSYGLQIGQADELCAELGIRSAFYMDGGGSATMWCETRPGDYEITGIVCDKDSAGNFGVERKVLSSLILAVGPSKSGIDSADASFGDGAQVSELVREPERVAYTVSGGITTVVATGQRDPGFKLDMFGGISADTYKYMVIEGCPTETSGDTFTLGVYPAGEDVYDTVIKDAVKVQFDCDGTWQRRVIDLSGVPGWTGRMNYVGLDLFDDSGVGVVGEGISLDRVRFFETAGEAEAYASGYGDSAYGDANGDGTLSLSDVSLILKKIAGWNVVAADTADLDRNGRIDLIDAARVLRTIAK